MWKLNNDVLRNVLQLVIKTCHDTASVSAAYCGVRAERMHTNIIVWQFFVIVPKQIPLSYVSDTLLFYSPHII